MCFWLSVRTRNEGTLTICFPTRMWRWRSRHARVVHRLGEAELEHERLEAALEERVRVEREHVIELVLGLVLLREKAMRKRRGRGQRAADEARIESRS